MVDHERHLSDRYLFSVLEGLMILMLVSILQKDAIDTSLLISVYAIALALPLLAVAIIIEVGALKREENDKYWLQDLNIKAFLGVLSYASCFTAITSLFWHFSAIAGVIFIVAVIIAGKIYNEYFKLPLPASMQKIIDEKNNIDSS